MKISTSIYSLLKKCTLNESAKIVKDAGFDYADFSFSGLPRERLFEDSFIHEMEKLKEYADEIGLPFNQAHAIMPSSVGDPLEDEAIFKQIVTCMHYASILNVKTIVVHPKKHLFYDDNKALLDQMNLDFYKALLPYCEKYNIKVATENMWASKDNQICPCVCSRAEDFARVIDQVQSPYIVGCLDIGHAFLTHEPMEKIIKGLGKDRLKALHVHDVYENFDAHLIPGVQSVDFDEVMRLLAEIDYDGELTLEADFFLLDYKKELMPLAAKHMAEVARFYADKFEMYRAKIQQGAIS